MALCAVVIGVAFATVASTKVWDGALSTCKAMDGSGTNVHVLEPLGMT